MTLRTIRSKNYKLHLSKSRMVGEIYFLDYEWVFESEEEAIQMCKDYQQQGGWSDESGEIGPLCKPITKDGGMPAQAVNNTWVSVSEPKEHQLLVCAALLRHF